MAIQAVVCGESCRFVLAVSGYAYPDAKDGPDSDWLRATVQVTAEAPSFFQVGHDVCLRADELEEFRNQLRELVLGSAEEATLAHLEDELGITIRMTKGGGTLGGFVCCPPVAILDVGDTPIDWPAARAALADIEALVDEFPVRDEPFAER
jgi:hypothetical protein